MAFLTNPQVQAFSRAQAAANDARPVVEQLEQLANVDPRLKDRVAELRTRLDYLTLVSQTALDLNRSLE